MTTTTTPVNTGKSTDRRKLRFASVADLRSEVDRIATAERAGTLRRSGNWTTGQVFGHVATWIDFLWTPNPLKPPWIVRWIVRRRKDKYFNEGLPAGVRIPRVEGGTLGTAPLSLDEGLNRLRAAIDRLDREAPTQPSPVFGPLTHEEGIKLNLRHAELHLSFLHA